jgi:hypothetical protein
VARSQITGIDTGQTGLRRPEIAATNDARPFERTAPIQQTGQFTRGLRRGAATVAAAAQQAVGAGAAILGAEEFARRQAEAGQERIERAAEASPLRVERVEQIRTDQGIDAFASDVGDYLAGLAGTQAPIVGSLALGAGVGGAAVRAATGLSVPAAAGVGAGAASSGLETGLIFGEIAADPEAEGSLREQAMLSAGGGVLAGSLDALPVVAVADRFGLGRNIRSQLTKDLTRRAARTSFVGRAAEGAAVVGAAEAGTEAAQTVIERATRRLANENFEVLGPEGVSELLNAAVAGGIIGGGIGALTGVVGPSTEAVDPFEAEIQAEADRFEVAEERQRALARSRIERLRGTIPDETLETLAAEADAFPDEEVMSRIDALTPQGEIEIRAASSTGFLSSMVDDQPLLAIDTVLDKLENPELENPNRREIELFRRAVSNLAQRNPDAVSSALARVLTPERVRRLEEEGVDLTDIDLEEIGRRREQSSLGPIQLTDLEVAENEVDFQNIFAQEPTAGEFVLGRDGRQFFLSRSRLQEGQAGVEDRITQLNELGEGTGEEYQLIPARNVVLQQATEQHGPRSAQNAEQFDAFVREQATQEAQRRNIQVPENPLDIFEGAFAVERRRLAPSLDPTDELSLTQADLSPRLTPDEVQLRNNERSRARRSLSGEGLVRRLQEIDERFRGRVASRRIVRERQKGGRARNAQEILATNDKDRNVAVFAPNLVRSTLRKQGLAPSRATPAEISRAFILGMTALRDAGFTVGKVPQFTVVMPNVNGRPFTLRDVIEFETARTEEIFSTVDEGDVAAEEAAAAGVFDQPGFEGEEFVDQRTEEELRAEGAAASRRWNSLLRRQAGPQSQLSEEIARERDVGVLAALNKLRDEEIKNAFTGVEGSSFGVTREFVQEVRQKLEEVEAANIEAAEALQPHPFHESDQALANQITDNLGVPRIELLTPSQAIGILTSVAGRSSAGIGNGSLSGFYVPTSNKPPSPITALIFVHPNMSQAKRIEILAHEIGHHLMTTIPKDSRDYAAIEAAWAEWRGNRMGLTREASVAALQKHFENIGIGTNPSEDLLRNVFQADSNQLLEQVLEYKLSIDEFFADQVALWLTRPTQKPTNRVERIFKAITDGFRKLFRALQQTLQTLAAERVDEPTDVTGETQALPSVVTVLERIQLYKVAGFVSNSTKNMDHVQLRINNASTDPLGNLEQANRLNRVTKDFYIAMAADDPTSDVAHAAIRNLVIEVLNPQEKRLLGRAFVENSANMRKMQRFFRDYPEALTAMNNDIIEAITYGIQLWSVGAIDVGPRTDTLFGLIRNAMHDATGRIAEEAQAADLLDQISEQRISISRLLSSNSAFHVKQAVERNAFQNVLNNAVEMYESWGKPWFDKVFVAGLGRMEATGNAALIQLARRIHTPPNVQGQSEGYLAAKETRKNQFLDDLARATNNTRDPEEINELWRVMMLDETPSTPRIRQMVRQTRRLLNDMFNYAQRSGVEIDQRQNYFPWVYDREYLQGHKDEFVELLLRPVYRERIDSMVKQYADAIRDMQARIEEHREEDGPIQFAEHELRAQEIIDRFGDITPEAVIEVIYENITEADGYSDVEINFTRASHTPFVRALNRRTLGFIMEEGSARDREDFLKFFNEDFDYVMRSYIEQITKRAEYTRVFNATKDPVTNVITSDVERFLSQAVDLGATNEDIQVATDFVNAAQGTHGARTAHKLHRIPLIGDTVGLDPTENKFTTINPRFQMANSWIMIWQNLRVLGLATFTSLADPVGILVRGGSMDTALASMRALAKKSEAREVAEKLGIINVYAINEMLGGVYGSNFMRGKSKIWNERFFKWIGLSALTKHTRIMATGAAIEFILSHARSNTDLSTRFLDELNLTREDIRIEANGTLAIRNRPEMDLLWNEFEATGDPSVLTEIDREERVRRAIARFVDEAVLRPNAATRPIWASDPHFALIFHLKSFIYTFHNQILRRVFNEVTEGNFTPLLLLFVYVPAMMAADFLRDIFRFGFNDESPLKKNWSLWDYSTNAAERAGLPGISTFLLDAQQDRQFGGLGIESFLGPTAASVFNLDDILFDSDQGRYQALLDQLPLQNTFTIQGLR